MSTQYACHPLPVRIQQLICSFDRLAVIGPLVITPLYEACPFFRGAFDHGLFVSNLVEGKDGC